MRQYRKELEPDLLAFTVHLAGHPFQEEVLRDAFDGRPEFFRGERLGHEIECPVIRGFYGKIKGCIRSDHHDLAVEFLLLDIIQHLDPIHTWKLIIEQDDVHRLRFDDFDGLFPGFRLDDFEIKVLIHEGISNPEILQDPLDA